MKKQWGRFWTTWLLLFSLAGCAVTDIDRTVNFSNLRTYSWGKSEMNAENPIYRGEMVDKKIRAAVDGEFQRLGIARDDRDPDFLVTYKTHTEKKRTSTGRTYPSYFYQPYFFGPFFPYAFGFYPYGWGMIPYSYYRSETYTEGTLVIDIMDAQTREVVWRGSVSGNVDNTRNLEKLVSKGVKAIMKKFPVQEKRLDSQEPAIT